MSVCPNCRNDAPVILDGISAYCTVCRAPRNPLDAPAVNLAGKPAKVGGIVVRVAGWLAIALGAVVALILGAIFQAIFPASISGFIIGGVIFAVALAIGWGLLKGGRQLKESGDAKAQKTQSSALVAYARAHRGIVSVREAAQILRVNEVEADAQLMTLVKDGSAQVDFDEVGNIFYRLEPTERVRVDGTSGPSMRIDDRGAAYLDDDPEAAARKRRSR